MSSREDPFPRDMASGLGASQELEVIDSGGKGMVRAHDDTPFQEI